MITDLDALTETENDQDGKRFLLRSATRPAAQPRPARRRRRAGANRSGSRRGLKQTCPAM
jgi:hypothetical protein